MKILFISFILLCNCSGDTERLQACNSRLEQIERNISQQNRINQREFELHTCSMEVLKNNKCAYKIKNIKNSIYIVETIEKAIANATPKERLEIITGLAGETPISYRDSINIELNQLKTDCCYHM